MTTREWVQVRGGKIVAVGLPESGELADGSSVSGYYLLDPDILAREGWQLIDDPGEPERGESPAVVRDVVVRRGKPVVEYRLLSAEPVLQVEGTTVRVTSAGAFDRITFRPGGQHAEAVEVETTDGVAELELEVSGHGVVPVWIDELEQEAQVQV